MKKIRKHGRTWHIPGESGVPDFRADDPAANAGILIKKNRKRSVWKVTLPDKTGYFIKKEKRISIPFFFPSKAEKEFRAFQFLQKKGIPCAEYVTWSATFRDSIVISRALPEEFCSLQQYWFSRQEADRDFLKKLCEFLSGIAQAGLFHPDFHSGNLMTDGEKIVLIDPVGIRHAEPTSSPGIAMLVPLAPVSGDIPMDELAEILHSSGLYSSAGAAREKMLNLQRRQYELILNEWEKRTRQILSGSSKFATETESGKFIRHSAWFQFLEPSEEAQLEVFEFPSDEGERYWLDSFRDQLMKNKREDVPVIFRKNGNKVQIFVEKNKKKMFFYGFRGK